MPPMPPMPVSSPPPWAHAGQTVGMGQMPGIAQDPSGSALPGLQTEDADAAAQKPALEPMQDSLQNDPLLNAGKAVWSGMKGLFSAVKGGGDGSSKGPSGATDSQPNAFYYCHETKRWRER